MKQTAAALALFAALLFGWSAVAAHASFLRSEPPPGAVLSAAPARVHIWFTEPLERGFSDIQVLDPTGRRVDRRDAAIEGADRMSMSVGLGPQPNSPYTVAWTALSSLDGHVTRGTFPLFIGVPAAAPAPRGAAAELLDHTPPEAAARWLSFLGLSLLLGGFGFRLLVLTPLDRPAHTPPGWTGYERWHRRLLAAGAALVAVATVAGFTVQLAVAAPAGLGTATPEDAWRLLTATRYGQLVVFRLALLALALGALSTGGSRPSPSSTAGAAIALLGVVLTGSLNSHGAAADPAGPAIASDWLHTVAVALWAGGIVNLVALARALLGATAETGAWALLGATTARFSRVATVAVVVIFATGLFQTQLHVGSFEALTQTLYGWSLAGKIALFLSLLPLGAFNQFVVKPRLGSSGAPGRRWAGTLSEILAVELVLLVGALAAAGLITSLGPARAVYDQRLAERGFSQMAQAGGFNVELRLAPGRPGVNQVEVRVTSPQGRPVSGLERVDVDFTYLDQALGSALVTTTPREPGVYAAQSPALGLAGRWQADLLLRPPGRDDVRTAFRFVVTPTGARAGDQAAAPPALPLGPVNAAAGFLALATLAAAGWGARRLGLPSFEGRTTAGAGVALAAVLGFVALRYGAGAVAPPAAAAANPFPATESSLQAGEAVYRNQCVSCHGVTGRGDGPAAAVINPRPADFRVHMAAGHTDGELFHWLTNGVAGTAMPAFGGALSEEQRWHVINYIKTFAPQDR